MFNTYEKFEFGGTEYNLKHEVSLKYELQVFWNGQLMNRGREGAQRDYVLEGNKITFTFTCLSTDIVHVYYNKKRRFFESWI